jgi:hypothetical protein
MSSFQTDYRLLISNFAYEYDMENNNNIYIWNWKQDVTLLIIIIIFRMNDLIIINSYIYKQYNEL